MRIPPHRYLILPTKELFEEHGSRTSAFKASGIDVKLLIEATLVARNRADNPRLERVGIDYDIFSSVEEEIVDLLSNGYLDHLEESMRLECMRESLALAVGSYYYIGDIFSRTLGDLNDIDADIVCEDWIQHDLIVTFHHR